MLGLGSFFFLNFFYRLFFKYGFEYEEGSVHYKIYVEGRSDVDTTSCGSWIWQIHQRCEIFEKSAKSEVPYVLKKNIRRENLLIRHKILESGLQFLFPSLQDIRDFPEGIIISDLEKQSYTHDISDSSSLRKVLYHFVSVYERHNPIYLPLQNL